jgi:hypothetical protein
MTFPLGKRFHSRCEAIISNKYRHMSLPQVSEADVAWWKARVHGNERTVRAVTGFSSEICAEVYAKYGIALEWPRERLFSVLAVLKYGIELTPMIGAG